MIFQDGGHALLKACMKSDWIKAESFIKAGAYLECRSEVRYTLLSMSCTLNELYYTDI